MPAVFYGTYFLKLIIPAQLPAASAAEHRKQGHREQCWASQRSIPSAEREGQRPNKGTNTQQPWARNAPGTVWNNASAPLWRRDRAASYSTVPTPISKGIISQIQDGPFFSGEMPLTGGTKTQVSLVLSLTQKKYTLPSSSYPSTAPYTRSRMVGWMTS